MHTTATQHPELPPFAAGLMRLAAIGSAGLMTYMTATVLMPEGLGLNQQSIEPIGLSCVITAALIACLYFARMLVDCNTPGAITGALIFIGAAMAIVTGETLWVGERILQQELSAQRSNNATQRQIADKRAALARIDDDMRTINQDIESQQQAIAQLDEKYVYYKKRDIKRNGMWPTEEEQRLVREKLTGLRTDLRAERAKRTAIEAAITKLETEGAAVPGAAGTTELKTRAYLRAGSAAAGYVVIELLLLFFSPKSLNTLGRFQSNRSSFASQSSSFAFASSAGRSADEARRNILDDLLAGKIQPGEDLKYSKPLIARMYGTGKANVDGALAEFARTGRCNARETGRGVEYRAYAPPVLAHGETLSMFDEEALA